MPVGSVNLYGSGPDAQVDQSQILRAQQLAQLLQQQANAPIEMPAPNAPMSITQGLSKLAEGLAARKQNQKVTGLQKDAVAKQQALIDSLFPQQPMAATPLGDSLAPGAGVMQNAATPGAQRPGLPSLTGSRDSDVALASAPGGLQAYLQTVAASKEKEKESANAFHVLPKGSIGVQGGSTVAVGQPDDEIVWKDNGSQLLPYLKNGTPAPGLKPIPKTPTPEQTREAFDERHASLLAAMAARGVTLPSGLRSKEQMKATLEGLVKKYPNLGDDEIADNLANGKISFGAQSKAAQVAGAQAGKVQLGLNEIQEFAPIALDASSKVKRAGTFMPINKLMQTADASISNPDLRDLKIAVTSMLNAYDQVAARAGNDVGKREHNHQMLMEADTPEVFERAVAMFQREGEAAERAAQKAMTRGPKPEGATGAHPADIQAILDSLKK